MKTLPVSFKQNLAQNPQTAGYVAAVVKLRTNETLSLNPNKFRISDNDFTQSGGDNFPIGLALGKTITINIENTDESYSGCDWYTAEIKLYTRLLFPNGNYYDILEGVFYVDDVEDNIQFLTITASDFISKTEIPAQIYTEEGGAPRFSTPAGYFEFICAEISNKIYGDGREIYASHLEVDGNIVFTNSDITLSQFTKQDKNTDVTYRDVLGYIAQIACGNIVITYENGEPKIDILEYDFSFLDTTDYSSIISGRRFVNQVNDIINCGTFGDGLTDTIICGTFSDTNYILLDKFIVTPKIEFSDINYTGVLLKYPVVNQNEYLKIHAPAGVPTTSNELELFNPVLTYNPNASTAQAASSSLRTVVNTLYSRLCNKYIRPFSGTYLTNHLLEFGDNVILMNRNGDLYKSFVSEHTYTYLKSSEISNNTPTVARNNKKYYNSF